MTTPERDKLHLCRLKNGPDWAEMTTEEQEEEWDFLRGVFDRRMRKDGYTPERRPTETVETDEATGGVLLRISAWCTRDVEDGQPA
jgi:hypothetical protein